MAFSVEFTSVYRHRCRQGIVTMTSRKVEFVLYRVLATITLKFSIAAIGNETSDWISGWYSSTYHQELTLRKVFFIVLVHIRKNLNSRNGLKMIHCW